jgi:4-amino-4-deoxy-L-arabinose transferase-like glycosyltransferase
MARRAKLGLSTPDVILGCAIAALFALDIFWLHRFRFGYITEWDESGYMSIALHNTDALRSGGLSSLISTVIDQGVQAPLVPLSAVPFNLAFGSGVDSSLVVEPVFFAILVLATYAVGRRLTTAWWALLAAICVASAPIVTDYSRIFHFSVPAAAMFTSALWALLRSEGLTRWRWALATGLLLGLMVLSRSMTIAYLPGFAVAAALPVLLGAEKRRRLLNLALLVGSGAALAALWYLPNIYSVGSYLLNFGYGAESAAYGTAYSPVSVPFWTRELGGLLDDLYLPLTAALALCLIAAAASALAGRRGRPAPWHGWRDEDGEGIPWEKLKAWLTGNVALTLVVVLEGYVAVTSSRNHGTAFALPWLPALIVLVVAATASIRQRPVRLVAVTLLVAVSAFNVAMKSDLLADAARPVSADLPVLGQTTVIEGTGIVQEEVAAAGYPTGGPTEPMPELERRWLPFAGNLARWATDYAEGHGRTARLAWGFDDLLLSNTRVALAAELTLSQPLSTVFLKPFPDGDTAASYRTQLQETQANLLVTAERGPGTPGIHLTRSRVQAGGRSVGFRPVRRFRLPDGRRLTVWWRNVEPPA